jgi:hypothetical protein
MYAKPGATLESVGKELGISRERVRQIVGPEAVKDARAARSAEASRALAKQQAETEQRAAERRGTDAESYNGITVGDRFGRLTVTGFDWGSNGAERTRVAKVRCDCGTETTARLNNLRKGATKSCGCLSAEHNWSSTTTHGLSVHPIYTRWAAAVQASHRQGITMADEWRSDPKAFIAWVEANLGPCPDGGRLTRIDRAKGYEPDNLKWSA